MANILFGSLGYLSDRKVKRAVKADSGNAAAWTSLAVTVISRLLTPFSRKSAILKSPNSTNLSIAVNICVSIFVLDDFLEGLEDEELGSTNPPLLLLEDDDEEEEEEEEESLYMFALSRSRFSEVAGDTHIGPSPNANTPLSLFTSENGSLELEFDVVATDNSDEDVEDVEDSGDDEDNDNDDDDEEEEYDELEEKESTFSMILPRLSGKLSSSSFLNDCFVLLAMDGNIFGICYSNIIYIFSL